MSNDDKPTKRERMLQAVESIAHRLSQPKSKSPTKLKLFIVIFLAIAVFGAGYIFKYYSPYRMNWTSSMPIGIYRVDDTAEPVVGSTVELCLPDQLAQSAYINGYIGKGRCKNGFEPLVKEVIAVPGDMVSIANDGITVNGKFYYAPQALIDSKGHQLTPQNLKNTKINGYVLYGMNNPEESWDSRYYGIVDRSNITGVLEYAS